MRIAIIGVGLIGGSIGLAARERLGAQVTGLDPSPDALATALKRGAIDVAAASVEEAVDGADVCFVCSAGRRAAARRRRRARRGRPGLRRHRRRLDQARARRRRHDDPRLHRRASARRGRERRGRARARRPVRRRDVVPDADRATAQGVLYERLHRIDRRLRRAPDGDRRGRRTTGCWPASRTCRTCSPTCSSRRPRRRCRRRRDRLPAAGPSFRDATRVAGANSAIWTRHLPQPTPTRSSTRSTRSSSGSPRCARRLPPGRATRSRRGTTPPARIGAGCSRPGIPGRAARVARRRAEPAGRRRGACAGARRAGVNITDMALYPAADRQRRRRRAVGRG